MISQIAHQGADSLHKILLQHDDDASLTFDVLNRLLRVRSRLPVAEVHRLAAHNGIDLHTAFGNLDIRQRGSDCCGGCAG